MTDTPEQQVERPTAGVSLRDRIKARERELSSRREHQILVPVVGFEDFLAVRYRPLLFEEEVKFEKRHEKAVAERPAEGYALVAADKLVNACERVCEQRDGKWHDTDYKLDARAARELFGRDLPDDATGRTAVRAIFADDEALVLHAAKYEELRQVGRSGVDRQLEGE